TGPIQLFMATCWHGKFYGKPEFYHNKLICLILGNTWGDGGSLGYSYFPLQFMQPVMVRHQVKSGRQQTVQYCTTSSAVICSSSSSGSSEPLLEDNYVTDNLENPFGFLGNLFVSDKSDAGFDLNTVEDQAVGENVNAGGAFHELVMPMGNNSQTNGLLEDRIESLTLEVRSIA
ncbi:unnamed protein product, partial [Allacma fusca]